MKHSIKALLVVVLAAVLGASLGGCSLFTTNLTPSPNSPIRGELRAAVSLTKDAWMLAAQACVDLEQSDAGMPPTCKEVLVPAHDYILAAATAVDNLDSAATVTPAAIICSLTAAVNQIANAPVEKSIVVEDAEAVVKSLGTVVCAPAPDAGSEGGAL